MTAPKHPPVGDVSYEGVFADDAKVDATIKNVLGILQMAHLAAAGNDGETAGLLVTAVAVWYSGNDSPLDDARAILKDFPLQDQAKILISRLRVALKPALAEIRKLQRKGGWRP